MSDVIQVSTTTGSEEDARRIAAELIDRRLAACVQVSGPINSHFRWEGKIEASREWLCTIKTRYELFEPVEQLIRSLHPYEEPEIVAIPVIDGSKSYLQWVNRETQQEESQ